MAIFNSFLYVYQRVLLNDPEVQIYFSALKRHKSFQINWYRALKSMTLLPQKLAASQTEFLSQRGRKKE